MRWWRYVVAAELRKILAFRADFWVTFVGQTVVQLLIARALWQSIFESSGNEVMEGFTLSSMTLYYLIVPIGTKMLLGENIGFLSREIYDGSFNRYLLYPISFFHYKTLTYLTNSFFYGIQLLLIYTGYSLLYGGMSVDQMLQLGLGFIIFMIASFAFLNLSIFVELISLWADNIWTLMVMLRFFSFFFGGAYIPLTFFPEVAKNILQFTPFPYLISLPVRTTMGMISTGELTQGVLLLLGWSVVFSIASKLLWNKGQYKYTGVGI